jgi:hypothetical protein
MLLVVDVIKKKIGTFISASLKALLKGVTKIALFGKR